MKKILLFIDSLCSGGAQRQLVMLACLLKEKGYQVTVLTYHRNEFYLPIILQNGIGYICEERAKNKWLRLYHITRIIIKENPDVLISYLSVPSIISCIAKLFNKSINLIVSERNTSQKNGIQEKIRFSLFRLSDYIVPNSYSQESFILENYSYLSPKVVTITNYVDTSHFSPLSIQNKSEPIILTVGRITPQKNIINYLKALKLVCEKGFPFRAIWYGNTDNPQYESACNALIEELKLSDNFEFKKATTDIVKAYNNADFFCLPSIYEGFPNVVCEAMSCGLPIICSNVCDNPSIVENNINGFLFNPNDVSSIADSILKMLNISSEEKNSFQNNNRNKAIELFSKDVFISKYVDLF